ncbi:T9SS type A sorting domain-containing protein [Winogradskyella ludwigii]|jgi:hypothetical protein|uniref:T9SS type A sorting domain-containing protein n=1 Tax=Winogradskyella ludwigii TaxID=2686076 RepID=UPI0015CD9587|nr:T9SS type A sorting domain-containing protein [Winogradskyella ludwigii]
MKKTLLSLILIFAFCLTNVHATLLDPEVKVLTNVDSSKIYFQEESFTISPNPSKDKLNVNIPKSSKDMTLEVFDILGKQIHKTTITHLETSIDVSHWKTGVYLVKMSNEKMSHTKRFIKE